MPPHAPEHLDDDQVLELLEQVRTGTREPSTVDTRTLDRARQASLGLVEDCTASVRRIRTAIAGREPTQPQRRDTAKFEALAHEYTSLAERLQRAVEQLNEKAKADAAEQIRRGEVEWANPNEVDGVPVGRGYHTGGGTTYRPDDIRTSWVRDLVAADLRSDPQAAERLRQNNREVATENRALSTTDGAGGEWVPPLWLINQGMKLARSSRVLADQVTHMALPAGTDSISLPRMATGTAVAEQVVQNTPVANVDATTAAITADVATIAGQQVLSLQLIDQSPVPIDQLVLQDLLAALATKTDTFVISNSGTNKVGLLNVAGTNQVTYTDATPTPSEIYPKIADAIQQIHTGRFLPPDKILMHPRRWAWFTAASDTTGRPLVVPVAQIPQNVLAAMGGIVSEGFVGSLQGLPVFIDANLPTNLGAGTNEDRIVIARSSDIVLMESTPRANAFREPLAAQLSVLLVVHNYVAVQAGRYPKSISIISGTGLVAPTF